MNALRPLQQQRTLPHMLRTLGSRRVCIRVTLPVRLLGLARREIAVGGRAGEALRGEDVSGVVTEEVDLACVGLQDVLVAVAAAAAAVVEVEEGEGEGVEAATAAVEEGEGEGDVEAQEMIVKNSYIIRGRGEATLGV